MRVCVVRCGVSSLELRGGTDADMAPPVAYLTDVVAPLLNRLLGLQLQVRAASARAPPPLSNGEGQVDTPTSSVQPASLTCDCVELHAHLACMRGMGGAWVRCTRRCR